MLVLRSRLGAGSSMLTGYSFSTPSPAILQVNPADTAKNPCALSLKSTVSGKCDSSLCSSTTSPCPACARTPPAVISKAKTTAGRSTPILDFRRNLNSKFKTKNSKLLPGPHLPPQIRLDEPIYVPIEHRGRAGVFISRAMVFHQRVGVEHVRAYLAAPTGGDVFALKPCVLLGPPGFLQIPQPGAQYPHCRLTVLQLAPLVLARHHDPRRQVPQQHSG